MTHICERTCIAVLVIHIRRIYFSSYIRREFHDMRTTKREKYQRRNVIKAHTCVCFSLSVCLYAYCSFSCSTIYEIYVQSIVAATFRGRN